MDHFELVSDFAPTGDQPQAIEELVKGFKEGNQFETLLGVTGSGKTFTMANVIAQLNKPTLVLAHNKTLAAQLYGEMKEFFGGDRRTHVCNSGTDPGICSRRQIPPLRQHPQSLRDVGGCHGICSIRAVLRHPYSVYCM